MLPACVSRLRIHGFKTFADPVALDILPGLTGLVELNGCGKSNVVDALRWAMGEGNARTLRGAEMEDVIFASTATLVHTDEYAIYARLPAWDYGHKTVCHTRSKYARDEDGDEFCEVHVNTMEGLWSLLRSWLRPHRGYLTGQAADFTSAFFNSCITRAHAAKPCSVP